MGVGAPDVLTSDADGSGGAVCADVERGERGEGTGAGCVAAGAALGAGGAADAVVNRAVDGVDVKMAVCASGGGITRLVQLNYCLWC